MSTNDRRTGVDRRKDSVPHELANIRSRLEEGTVRMDRMEAEIKANTDLTREMRDLMEVGRAGFKVLGWVGHAAKWVAGVGAAVTAIYAAWHAIVNGGPRP